MTMVLASLMLLALAAAPAPAPGAPAVPEAPRSSGSELEFHGWSPDSRLVAYTRHRAAKVGSARTDQHVQRFVTAGAFAGFGRMVGGDVSAYARAHGYVVAPAPRRPLPKARCLTGPEAASPADAARASGHCWEIRLGARELVLAFDVADGIGWRITEGDVELARHAFDRIYVGFDPELYPSPDGRQAVLVVHLDSGWDTDAAVYPLSLVAPAPDAAALKSRAD
ncbi:MAG: hypothetical protein U1F43_14220 [Myxococcota bacterium]